MDDNQRLNQEPQAITSDSEKIEKLEEELDQIEINKTREVDTPQETIENKTPEVPKVNQESLKTQNNINVTSISSYSVKEKVAPITNPSYQVPATGKTDNLIRIGIFMMVIALVVTVASYFMRGSRSNLDDSQINEVTEKIQSVIGR